jgi:hypothetical protein
VQRKFFHVKLTDCTTLIAAQVVEIALKRIIPALAVGLVAVAHELCPESARAEMERRASR